MKIRKSVLIGIIITLFLLIGVGVAFFLTQEQQDIRQRAGGGNPFEKSLVFDGQTTYVKTPGSYELRPPFTIEGWIKPDFETTNGGTPYGGEIIAIDPKNLTQTCQATFSLFTVPNIYGQPQDNYYVELSFNTTELGDATVEKISESSFLLKNKEWAHVAFTIDQDNNVTLFLNGKKIKTITLSTPFCTNGEYIIGGSVLRGISPDAPSEYSGSFKGEMDEIRVSRSVRYSDEFIPSNLPFTVDAVTAVLAHLNDSLIDEANQILGVGSGNLTYVASTVPTESPTVPACVNTVATCEWDPVDGATGYHYKVIESDSNTTIIEGDLTSNDGSLDAAATKVTFTSEPNKTYQCIVNAINACGAGPTADATATCTVSPTPTHTPTPTPTVTGTPPTPTATATPTTPPPPPTNTPTPTVPQGPTATPRPTNPPAPTNTPLPGVTNLPTATPTPVPQTIAQQVDTPTPTMAQPGSALTTITVAGGILLTIIGAIILFAL